MSERLKERFCKPSHERALLSYCFKSLDKYYTIASTISDNDFLRPEHKLIWVIFGTLTKRGIDQFDVSMVVNEAQQNNILKEIGGYDYIIALVDMDLTETNIDYYIDKVLDSSVKYQLYMKLNYDLRQVGDDALDEDISSLDMIGKVTKDVMDLSLKSKSIKAATNLAEGIDEYIEDRRTNPVELCGLSTGFPILDKLIDGMVPGTLTVICARPKEGKSTMLSNIGAYVAYQLQKPVLYIDTEMSFDEWRPRIMSMMSDVPERDIKHGGYNNQQLYNINKAAEVIKKGKFFHEYMPGYSVDKLMAIYNKYKYIEDIGLAIFDYIKAPPGQNFKDKKEYQILGDVTTALKDLAGELNIPFLCANQINRQDDVADSDRIIRYADVLMFFKKRTKEELDRVHPFEKDYGFYKLFIKRSRRGGGTPEEGIGFDFIKRVLQMSESTKQLIDYNNYNYQEQEDQDYEISDSERESDYVDSPEKF